jgi:hypothetical protein
MAMIMEMESHLSQRMLDDLCLQCHIPLHVHPILPDLGQAIHQYLAGKIGMYSRFFDYGGFCLPLSTFFVDILNHYRIHISQLSLFGAGKVSHFEILCRAHEILSTVALFRRLYVNSIKNGWLSFIKRTGVIDTCYDRPLDSVKGCRDRFFWVDAFAYHDVFPWHVANGVVADSVPDPSEYSEEEYNTLTRSPAPFRRYPEVFLCWVGLSRYYPFKEDEYPVFRLRGEGWCVMLLSFY